MDWLAGSRMHFVEIILLRSITSLPLFTLGFAPSVMQAYTGFVFVWSSLLHANVGGSFTRLGPRLAHQLDHRDPADIGPRKRASPAAVTHAVPRADIRPALPTA